MRRIVNFSMFRAVIFICLLFLIRISSFAQLLPPDTLIKKFDSYRKAALQEKIFIHTDRTLYLTGEVIWFSIYCVEGSYHKPLDVSKVVYVEIMDKIKEPLLQGKVFIKNGVGQGSFVLPTSLSSGNYVLRAYTNWMRNYSPEFFFHQYITIINPFVKPESEPLTSVKASYEVSFFPEGGDIVNKLRSKVAFKVNDQTGKGVDFTGAIVNELNDTVAHFKPQKFGIGYFFLTPDISHQYRAVIRDSKKILGTYKFPDTKSSGTALFVKDSTSQLLAVNVMCSSGDVPLLYMLVHARQIIAKVEMKFVKNGKATFIVNKKDLKDGVSHITIFNEAQRPIAERLYFKKPEGKLDLSIKSDLLQYDVRKKASLTLTASANSHLSVSVYKVDSLPTIRQQNISEYLLLTSDLKGAVESPEYYLDDGSDVQETTDNLMLTHGWRRFNWKEILDNKPLIVYPPEYRSHILKGHVTDQSGLPASSILAYVSYPGKIVKVYGSRSDQQGEVQFEMQDFWGAHKIMAQLNPKKDSLLKIKIVNPFSSVFSSRQMPAFELPSFYENQLIERSVNMQVQDIFNRSQTERFVKPQVDSTAFYGKSDETYFLDDYTRFPVMEEVMREYVPGVFVRKHRDGFHFIVLDNVNKSVFRDDPMILLDGLPIFDINKIMEFDPLKVKKLEVVTRKYFDGPLVFPGIVSYSTYKGDLGGFQIDPRVLSINYEGLQLQREFYAPQYDNPAMRESRLPDGRSLLYWNPSFSATQGLNKLEFYTSDLTGSFQVVIQGISKDGKPGMASHIFFVQKDVN